MRFHIVWRVLAVYCPLMLAPAAGAEIRYDLTDLGTLGGFSYAQAVNDNGDVTGYYQLLPTGSGSHAFLYTDGHLSSIDAASISSGFSINSTGQIVGISSRGGSQSGLSQTGFLYSGGQVTSLDPLFTALGINDHSQIVGEVEVGGNSMGAIYANGTITMIGALDGTGSSTAAINNSGHVAATVYTKGPSGQLRSAPAYYDGTLHHIPVPTSMAGQALAINDRDQVFGYFSIDGTASTSHAFLYSDGTLSDLGTYFPLLPSGINNLGQIVFQNGAMDGGAYLYSDGTVTNLNTLIDPGLGWRLDAAMGINNLGQIVGWGRDPSGGETAYLLTPVPEPASFSMVALLTMLLARRSHD